MKTSVLHGQQYPPLLSDILQTYPNFTMTVPAQQQMTCPVDANDTCSSSPDAATSSFYATGSMRLNIHIGHLVWDTMFLRLHNDVCDLLAEQRPDLTDQEVSN